MSEAADSAVRGEAVDFGIERILQEIERVADPAAQALVRELVASILDLHAAGLRRMLEIVVQAAADAPSLRNAFEQDALVRLLLVLHDLSALSPQQRVQQALEELHPYLQQTGTAATLVHLDESAVAVRLTVPGNAEAAAVEHVRRRVEWALMEVAPSITHIEITVHPTAVGLIPVSALSAAPRSIDEGGTMPDHYTEKTRLPSHSEGTKRGEEWTWTSGKEAGREGRTPTARSSTSINPKSRSPIDPRMPQMPPP